MNPLVLKRLMELSQGGAGVPPSWQTGDSAAQEAPPPVNVLDYFKAIRPELFSQESVTGAIEADSAENARRAGLRRMESGAAGFGYRAPNYAGMEDTQESLKTLAAQQDQALRSAEVGSKVGAFQSQQAEGDGNSPISRTYYRIVAGNPELGPGLRALGPEGAVSKAQIDAYVRASKEGAGVGETRSKARDLGTQADRREKMLPLEVEGEGYKNADLKLKPAATAAGTAKAIAETKKIETETGQIGVPPPGKVAEGEEKLRKEFGTQPAVVAMGQVGPMRAIVNSTSPDGPGDMSMLYAFMKMIDPGSAVREGEFANASNSGGIPDYIRIAYNKAIQGDKLSDEMRAKFRAEANNVYAKRLDAYNKAADWYKRLAAEQGANPDRVVGDLGYGAAPAGNGYMPRTAKPVGGQ